MKPIAHFITQAKELLFAQGTIPPTVYVQLTSGQEVDCPLNHSEEMMLPMQQDAIARAGWELAKDYPDEEVLGLCAYVTRWISPAGQKDAERLMYPQKDPQRQEHLIVSWRQQSPLKEQVSLFPIIRSEGRIEVGPERKMERRPSELEYFLRGFQEGKQNDDEVFRQREQEIDQGIAKLSPEKRQELRSLFDNNPDELIRLLGQERINDLLSKTEEGSPTMYPAIPEKAFADYTVTVGQRYFPERSLPIEEGTFWNWAMNHHDILLMIPHPNSAEIQAIRQGAVEFALIEQDHLLWLMVRFMPLTPTVAGVSHDPGYWHIAPYNWHIMSQEQRDLGLPQAPETLSPNDLDVITITMIDCERSIVQVIRRMSLAPAFTKTLYEAIHRQATQPIIQEQYAAQIHETYHSFQRDVSNMIHLASAWCRLGEQAIKQEEQKYRGISLRMRNYLWYKAVTMQERQGVLATIDPDSAEFAEALHAYAMKHAKRWVLRPSAVAMLSHLMATHAEQQLSVTTIAKLFPPDYHQWIEFQFPLFTTYGPIGALFLSKQAYRADVEQIARNWPATRRERLLRYTQRYWEEQAVMHPWTVELATPMADSQISTFTWNKGSGEPFLWQRNELEDCPLYTCQRTPPGTFCPACQTMHQNIPRLLLLLYGMFLGLFQEVMEIQEETSVEKKEILVKGGKKKKVEISHHYNVVEVSQARRSITCEEERELEKARNSWIMGRSLLTLADIDWLNPPEDEAVILAESNAKGYTRRYTADRYVNVGGTTQKVDPYKKPRQPMTFKRWKERQWQALEVKAKRFEG